MQNRFDDRDFEQFVKQNADQYRMFPSEKVWNGIHNTLHTRRRWYGIGLGLLILTTGVVTWVMLDNSGKNRAVVSSVPKIVASQPVTEKKQTPQAIIAPAKIADNKTYFITSADNLEKKLFNKELAADPESGNNSNDYISETTSSSYTNPPTLAKIEPAYQPESIVKITQPIKPVVNNKEVNNTPLSAMVNEYSFTTAKNHSVSKEPGQNIGNEKISTEKKDIYPLSIESVINSYTFIKKRRKNSLQVYITPTISYRELKENKPFINAARNAANASSGISSANVYYTDINSIVTHKPDIGLQMGFSVGFPLSKNIKMIGGLQFNVSKYDIRAYSHPVELATIALSNAAGGTNTVSALTNYRNAGGYTANWLHNLYFSIAAPIGLELKLMGKRKTYVGISGTVQPTYMLSNRAYLISTDYKNYAEIPSLIRKWNINTGFEMFAGYTTGNLKWRIGPQVRYQAMSSFKKKYPVQEHLFDFGLKLGLMLNK
jgi:hypothetical protein